MKALTSIILVAIVVVGFGAGLVGQRPGPERPRLVPFDSLYSAVDQDGMMSAEESSRKGAEAEYRVVSSALGDYRLSNLFLVSGADFPAAVRSTEVAARGDAHITPDDPIAARNNPRTARYWAVVYFGSAQSGPPQWLVRGVEVYERERRVRVRYTKHRRMPGEVRNRDVAPYLFWIPLGEFGAGDVVLDLFEEGDRKTTMTRTVTIP